jgi:hypothetical protein
MNNVARGIMSANANTGENAKHAPGKGCSMDDLSPEDKQLADAAKRASAIVNGYITFMPWDELCRKWIAFRLSDGGSDGVLYDSKRDAVRHQSDEFLCFYQSMRNMMGGANERDMAIFIKWNRDAYNAGFRLPDPDDVNGGREVIMTTGRYDQAINQRAESARISLTREQMKQGIAGLGFKGADADLMLEILTS